MRYVDSGSRDPKDALGAWLGAELLTATPVAALRVQSGFFGSDALGYFEDPLKALEQSDGHTRILVGSNDGQTPRAAIANLLTVAGPPRAGLGVGVVSFQTGFFHPKVFHFERADGSSTAYVGSANLTRSGVTSLHVEAGIILDTKQGDSPAVLVSIAEAIDAWFIESRPGLYVVNTDADLDPLVSAGVLGVPAPPRAKRAVKAAQGSGAKQQLPHSLKPLVVMPGIQVPLPTPPVTPVTPPPTGQTSTAAGATSFPPAPSPAPAATPTPPTAGVAAKHWGKVLPASDAQRKVSGNQSGAIALTQGDYRHQIDQTDYFRNDLFASQAWSSATANTGQPIEVATVPMHVTIGGTYHGVLDFKVSNASNRESSQNNYTAQLHLEPISPVFRQTDMTDAHLEVALDGNGEYWLTIT